MEIDVNGERRLGKKLANLILLAVSIGPVSNSLAQAMTCNELAGLELTQGQITSAEIVPQGQFSPPDSGQRRQELNTESLPEFCRVQARLTPSSDSDIKMEVWLPTSEWNGDYHTVGNSGWGGVIAYPALVESVQRGYASASTDTGHTEPGGSWAPGHPEKVKDYGGRAIHETTVKAKAIMEAFYGETAESSFMTGCSLGGLQTMNSIQDYPEDFDAVVAGSPHFNMTRWNATQLWPGWLLSKDPEKLIPREKMDYVFQTILQQCDGSDGLKDGIVDDPLACDFEPASMQCKAGETAECLTAKQVEFLQQVYAGPVIQSTGESINPGPVHGNEGDRYFTFSLPPSAPGVAIDLFKYLVFEDPDWDWTTLDYDQDILLTANKVAPIIDAENPNLGPYFERGGKLIMYVGSYEATNYTEHLGYIDKVRETVGAEVTDEHVRAFVVPGMGHCGGGIGADTFDKLGAIAQWQETGEAPDVLDASHVEDGEVTFTRPLCAYPNTARYSGSGDPSQAENFVCAPYRE